MTAFRRSVTGREDDESRHVPLPAPDTASVAVRLLRVPLDGRTLRLRLHLEGSNPFGSIKDRTAHALLASLERDGALRPGGHVVESTSGNMGIALAGMCAARGYRCTLVVDDVTCGFSVDRMTELGARLIRVETGAVAHAVGARIEAVHRFLAAHPDAAWTDQYNNPAAPAVHARTTGPALLHGHGRLYGGSRVLPPPDAVAVPVSTGGTLAGTARYLRGHAPGVRIWAVDAVGSAATGGTAAARPGKLPGFGSGLRSRFLTAGLVDRTLHVADAEAAAACRIVRRRTGVALGGSAGAAVLAACRAAAGTPDVADVACVCPDGADRYEDTVYAAPPRGSGADGPDAAADADEAALGGVLAGLEDEARADDETPGRGRG